MSDSPQIHFDDGLLLVVDKPAGLATQRTRDGEAGLYEQLRAARPGLALHHRLDRNASGLLVFGQGRLANRALSRALKRRELVRVYEALCDGEPLDALWSWPVDGREARTHVQVLGAGPEGTTRLRCTLDTGRRHQIRVHAAMAGVPLLGDARYGGDASRTWTRLGLHAVELQLTHPVTGERMAWHSPPPWSEGDLTTG